MHLSLFAVLVGAALLIDAQDVSTPTSPPGVTCVVQCSTQALPAGPCSSITDYQCICTNEAYQQAFSGCLTANCNAEDMQSAMTLQKQNCGPFSAPSGSNGSSPAPPPPSTAEPSAVPPSVPGSVPAPSGGSATTPKPTTGTGNRPATTGNAAQGQAALLFTQDVLVAFGMVWFGIFLGVLVA